MAPRSDSIITGFGATAKGLARNPLGIIALFLVLVYSIASLILFGAKLESIERLPLIYFLVVFPVLVLGVFTWLVTKHSGKLFAPSDYRDESNYVRMQLSAAVSLTAASSKSDVPSSGKSLASIVDTVQHSTNNNSAAYRSKKCLLWVDDNPGNNIYERSAFEVIGIEIVISLNTSDAISQIKERAFGSIISDMGRTEGPREGYVLLDSLRQSGNRIPLFFYASSDSASHKAETERHGGLGCTNNPEELFQMVTKAVLSLS